ncbi:hypothetical protein ACFE04_031102 [Oxalis oulophora]
MESNGSLKCIENEKHDSNANADDDPDLCNAEQSSDKSTSTPSPCDPIEPYVDMEFKSIDEAREFYSVYGRRTGFTTRTHNNRRSRINNMDEKDQRIQYLTTELNNER